MAQENIWFYEYNEGSYNMVDYYLTGGNFFQYEDSYSYYDNDVDKILLSKKSDNEYFIRYNDIYKITIAPLQLKIKNFYSKMHRLKNNITLMSIQSFDEEFFKKIREIWNKITELIGINNAPDFVKTTLDDDSEFIMVDVLENTSIAEGNYRSELIIILHSVIDNCLKAALV